MKLAAEESSCCECHRQPDDKSQRDERKSSAEHEQHDIAAVSTQRHTYCNFAGAAAGIVDSNPVQPNTSQHK